MFWNRFVKREEFLSLENRLYDIERILNERTNILVRGDFYSISHRIKYVPINHIVEKILKKLNLKITYSEPQAEQYNLEKEK